MTLPIFLLHSRIGGDVSRIVVPDWSHPSFPHGPLCLATKGQSAAAAVAALHEQLTARLSLKTCSREPAVPRGRNSSTPFYHPKQSMFHAAQCGAERFVGRVGRFPSPFHRARHLVLTFTRSVGKGFSLPCVAT